MVKWYCTRRPETGIWMSLAMSSNCLRRLSPLRTLERFELRTVMLCIFLVAGWSSPVFSQQLKAITNSIGMKLVLILPGEFIMGSPIKPQREVTISQWYYLAAHEVTQKQYEKVMGNNPSIFKGAKNPVEMVSWEDAVCFCKKLSEVPEEKVAGREYRLPTEAEWEYACRAASSTSFCSGDTAESLSEFAWFGDGRGKTQPVGEKKANRWGLYDMHGNVFEWCQDWGADYLTGATTDPQGPSAGSLRVYRGGSWSSDADSCRSAYRNWSLPSNRDDRYGFRLALSPSVK